jgi:peptide-methionine (S)-S-oxide reductase
VEAHAVRVGEGVGLRAGDLDAVGGRRDAPAARGAGEEGRAFRLRVMLGIEVRASMTFRLAAVLVLGLWPAVAAVAAEPKTLQRATFAGGCFWCMEPPFEALDGVVSVTSGYTGGSEVDPTYKQVSSGITGHTEAVEIVYDPAKVSYERLLDLYWHNVDPTTDDRQFCDRGRQYRPAIFTHDEAQKAQAEASRAAIEKTKAFKDKIVVEIVAATRFYPAEDYHQDYYKKNPIRYKYYRNGCRRDDRLDELWGKAARVGQAAAPRPK